MTDPRAKLQAVEGFVGKLRDIHNSYIALVEKMARLQLDAMEAGLDSIGDKLNKPFSDASKNAKLLEGALHETEAERNKLQGQA